MTVIMSHATIWIRDAKRNPYSYDQLYQGNKLLKKRKKTYSKKFLKLLKDSQKNIKYFGKTNENTFNFDGSFPICSFH